MPVRRSEPKARSTPPTLPSAGARPVRARTAAPIPAPARADAYERTAAAGGRAAREPKPSTVPASWSTLLSEVRPLRRSDGPEGSERLLNDQQAARLRHALPTLPAATQQDLRELLEGFTGAAAPLARGLILRAIAARLHRFDDGALDELRGFARRLHGMGADEMRQRASVLDLDSRRNDGDFDPQALSERRGVIRRRGADDAQANNDGLYQRFTATCGPTTIQMALAEADPVYALAVHDAGLLSDRTDDDVADFQRKLLEACGGSAVGRRELLTSARLKNALGRLRRSGQVSDPESAALIAYAGRRGPFSAAARRALEACRGLAAGFPTDGELDRLRHETIRRDEGTGAQEFEDAVNAWLGPLVGARYAQTRPRDGFARGQAYRHLDAVDRALRHGYDVPFGIVEPGHWMLLSAVHGRKPERQFLVSDPEGGRTAWVTERDLVKGTFVDRQFHLCTGDERGYVDSFLLPSVDRE